MWTLYMRNELQIIDLDPECADIDNPKGYIYGEVPILIAEDDDGYRFEYQDYLADNSTDFEEFRLNLQRLANENKINFIEYNWRPIRPCYGSKAYIESNQSEIDYREEEYLDNEVPF